jgi:hypothetical protein
MNRPVLVSMVTLGLMSARGGAQGNPRPDSVAKAPKAAPVVPAYRNRVIGVFESGSGDPIEGARVFDVLSGMNAVTTSTGTASLVFLPEGGSLVRIAKAGYETQTFLATISPKDTVPVTIVLVRSAGTTLAPVVTTDTATHHSSPLLQGFEERRSQGFGHFITEAELRKSDGRELTAVLEVIPGLRMVVYKAGTYVASSRDQKDSRLPSFQQFNIKPDKTQPDRTPPDLVLAQACWVSVYTDGIRTYDPIAMPGVNPPDFSQLDVHQFGAIEYYPGSATVPAQFNGSGNTCGTLLLWTRER